MSNRVCSKVVITLFHSYRRQTKHQWTFDDAETTLAIDQLEGILLLGAVKSFIYGLLCERLSVSEFECLKRGELDWDFAVEYEDQIPLDDFSLWPSRNLGSSFTQQ